MGCENKNKNLFGDPIIEKPIEVNIYADETMDRNCPYTNHNWHYICLIVERLDKSLLNDIINERYCNNPDTNSLYFKKNNKLLHWKDLSSADGKNICKRWFEYIINPEKSSEKFYCYILGLNESYLNDDEFDTTQKFNSIYNRFFRTAIEYALKCFFSNKEIVIKNIYHEQGQQQNNAYFPWHPIDKLEKEEQNFQFETDQIVFLGKDHTKNEKSNILQLCDCFLGAVVNLIHGLKNMNSNKSKNKLELMKIIYPLLKKMMTEANNKNSPYDHANRIMIRFFPKEKTEKQDLKRRTNQFYCYKKMKYEEDISPQQQLSLPFLN